MGLMLALSPEMVECGARRYLAIENRRFTASRGNGWQNESFADCLNRSMADGFWEQVFFDTHLVSFETFWEQQKEPKLQTLDPKP
jgi:hypothetical protein